MALQATDRVTMLCTYMVSVHCLYTQTVLILYVAINPTYMLVVQKALTNMTVCAGIFLTMN